MIAQTSHVARNQMSNPARPTLPSHDRDDGPPHHGFAVVGSSFVVADQAAVAHQPTEGPFHDPPAGQHEESGGLVTALDDSDRHGQHGAHPTHQATGHSRHRPRPRDREEPPTQQGQQPTRPSAIPDRGSNDDHNQHQAYVSTRGAACGVLIFFPAIETSTRSADRVCRRHRLPVNRSGRGQISAAAGHPHPAHASSRPVRGPNRARSTVRKRYTRPSQGGKSTGNARHSMPQRVTQVIAASMARRSCSIGRPSGPGAARPSLPDLCAQQLPLGFHGLPLGQDRLSWVSHPVQPVRPLPMPSLLPFLLRPLRITMGNVLAFYSIQDHLAR
jgi:hypothetical protein